MLVLKKNIFYKFLQVESVQQLVGARIGGGRCGGNIQGGGARDPGNHAWQPQERHQGEHIEGSYCTE